MKFSDFVVPEAIIPDLQSTDRNGVIRELIVSLASVGALEEEDVEAVARAAIHRENQGSTGFGKGVAIPHVKHAKVSKIMAAIGRSSNGVDFVALDRAPVYTIMLLLSPLESRDGHLQAMATMFTHFQRDSFRRFFRQSETTDAILELIREADEMPAE
ncbi:MAG: PTS sugar transporter subunit IIA [Phycisphaerae bacterium]